jgi:hypothetical protein
MSKGLQCALALTLCACVPAAAGETAILQLQVIEGEGAVQTVGTRSSRPITIQVTDETGKPVEGAAVSFRLSDEDPGIFRTGLKTEVLVSGKDGRVSVWGIEWGRTPGPVKIRVTAAKDQARAGTLISQYLTESAAAVAAGPVGSPRAKSSGRWRLIAVVAAGIAGGVLAAGITGGEGASAPGPTGPTVQVGLPTISIGKP